MDFGWYKGWAVASRVHLRARRWFWSLLRVDSNAGIPSLDFSFFFIYECVLVCFLGWEVDFSGLTSDKLYE